MTINFSELSPYGGEDEHICSHWCDFYEHHPPYGLMDDWLDGLIGQYQTLGDDDASLTDWLIKVFDALYGNHTKLVHSLGEPEYFAPKDGKTAYIAFAHGFFASALHEISHWCVAGSRRRGLDDFGYWYCPDGRDEMTQRQFEQVEIKPQAIECLFNQALGRYFYVSADNLNADFDTSNSTFDKDVYDRACEFLKNPKSLPPDARRLLWVFLRANGFDAKG